ncbi:hypothetical protein FA95DRAFT_1608333 [Auriscalpium vulgare]|uniref:Uncharacterized protein n=1 Tax=Auriscalpium vulgare TaxID=40419 RepID=A0ACB8RKJ9_9AGAM|nr:hypothetical protein FA95DRAFT_1608333 [Auriscalpium vulgare]
MQAELPTSADSTTTSPMLGLALLHADLRSLLGPLPVLDPPPNDDDNRPETQGLATTCPYTSTSQSSPAPTSVTSGEWEFFATDRATTRWVQVSHLTSAQQIGLVPEFCARARLAALSPFPTTSSLAFPALHSCYVVRARRAPASGPESYRGLPFLSRALGDRHDIIQDAGWAAP